MRDTLEDLYYSNVSPHERQIVAGSPLGRALERAARYEEKLTALLKGGDRKLFLAYLNAENEASSTMALENFILGFRLGMRLAVEGLMENGDGSMTNLSEGDGTYL